MINISNDLRVLFFYFCGKKITFERQAENSFHIYMM